jgi:hypothetical protein
MFTDRPASRIVTTRYQNRNGILAANLAPVRITLGNPRFKLGYELRGTIRNLAPTRAEFAIDDVVAFTERYRARLDRVGPFAIRAAINDLVVINIDRDGLALCCFCELNTVAFCHRRIAAAWIDDNMGIEVPEL